MPRKQITITIDSRILADLTRIKKETGVSISQQVDISLRGYAITRKTPGKNIESKFINTPS